MPNALRQRVESASMPLLTRLSRMHPMVPFAVMLILLVGGTLLRGYIGFILTAIAALIVGWLFYLGWPRFTTSERLGRTAVLFLVVAVAVVQLFPHK